MLKWICELTRKDNVIRNEYVQGAAGAAGAAVISSSDRKTIEVFGHLNMLALLQVDHGHGTTRKKRKTRWMDAVNTDMKMVAMERKMTENHPLTLRRPPDDGRRQTRRTPGECSLQVSGQANLNRSQIEPLYYHNVFQHRRIKTRTNLNSPSVEVMKHVAIHDYTEKENIP